MGNHGNARISRCKGTDNFTCIIRTGIVNDNNINITIRLGENAGKTTLYILINIVCRDNNRNFHRTSSLHSTAIDDVPLL